MTERSVDFLLIGGGLAAAKAAEGIREAGGAGSALVLTQEPEPPYERPPLSKEYLRGEVDRAATRPLDEAWYAEHGVEVAKGTRATGLDPATRTVRTGDGDELRYGRLLLATGAWPVPLHLPGAELGGVHYLRTVADSDRIRAALGPGRRLVVVGGGFIGAEVAASATQLGTSVTLVEAAETLWIRAVGGELGRFFEVFLRDRGVDVRVASPPTAFEGDGRVSAVVVGGERVPADAVVVGVGVRPATELAEQAGLATDNGVLVDDQLRTSAENVWAAGDVAANDHPLYDRIRVEHWDVALNQGTAAGRNMAGAGERYDTIPYFFSDQFDLSMSYLGHTRDADDVVVRGTRDLAQPSFIGWYLERGVPRAALLVNAADQEDPVREVLRRATPVDRERLGDPAIEVRDL